MHLDYLSLSFIGLLSRLSLYYLSQVFNVHLDYLIPAGERISNLSTVKLEHASTGGGFEGQAILMMLMILLLLALLCVTS